MTTKFYCEAANIYKCPKAKHYEGNEVTVGDLNANAMMFMHFLVKTGVVEISDADYEALKAIYVQEPITEKNLETFKHIIENITVNNQLLIRLIGDEVCDRGQNDYFIFLILKKLKSCGLRVEIILSNHGLEFLLPYEKNMPFMSEHLWGYDKSLDGLAEMIQEQLVTRSEIDDLVNQNYLPQLKLLSYSKQEHHLTIFSHAPIGLEAVSALAKYFNIAYNDETIEDLIKTIDAINQSFIEHVKRGTVHTLPKDFTKTKNASVDLDPVMYVIWNRNYNVLNRPKEHQGYQLSFVHGHDSKKESDSHNYNLDSPLGKSVAIHAGALKFVATMNELTPKLFPEAVVYPDAHIRQKEQEFLDCLYQLYQKSEELALDGSYNASVKANWIYFALNGAYRTYKSTHNVRALLDTAKQIIQEHREELDKHRGMSECLVNIILGLMFLAPLLIKGIYNTYHDRPFLFVHKTKTAILIDDIDEELQQLSEISG